MYHDGELDIKTRAELNDALRSDAELRARYAKVCRLDQELRNAFLNRPAMRRRQRQPRHFRASALAACLLAAVSLTWWFTLDQRSSQDRPTIHNSAGSRAGIVSEYQPIRVVFAVPMGANRDRPEAKQVAKQQPDETEVAEDHAGFLDRFDDTLSTGSTERAMALLEKATGQQRVAAYRRLGAVLRSAESAEQILDRLGPQEQLAVCTVWAREPVAQPAVFERLRRLSKNPDLSEDVRRIVAGLSEDARLRPWLQGYQLLSPESAARNLPS